MSKKLYISLGLLVLLAFAIPIEHKYDKLFRFYSLTLIPQGLEVSQSYEKKIYFYVTDLIALALFLIGLFWYRIPFRKLFGNPLWIIFLCAFLSIAVSPFFNYPIPYFRLLQLFTPIALFSFIANAFSIEEREKVTRYILMAIVAAGLFQSAVAIAQYFNQGPLGLRLLGETNVRTIFTVHDGSRWLIDQLLQRKSESVVVIRASGTFPHANVFGGFMVLSIMATYALIMQSTKRMGLLLSTLPLQFFAMCLSFSRAALFAWALSTFIWFALIAYRYGLKNQSLRRIGTIIALIFVLTSALLFNQYFYRGGVISSTPLSKDSDNIRKFHQTTALNILKDNPLLGLGLSQFSERAQPYFPQNTDNYVRSTAPHNMFLFLACETGLISLTAFLIFILSLCLAVIRSPITVETATFFSLLVGFIFIGFCDFYPILFQHGKLMFFLIAALLSLSANKKPTELLSVRVSRLFG
jgi:O-antigen ligase